MKKKTLLSLIAIAIGITGILMIALNSNWYVAAGVFLALYGDNIDKAIRG